MKKTSIISVIMSIVCLIITIVFIFIGLSHLIGIPIVFLFAFLSIIVRYSNTYKSLSFTILIFSAVTLALFYPVYFTKIGSFNLKTLIIPLVQIIMFGMGTSMSLRDFKRIISMPKGVLIGLICQFTIMPVLGFSIAHLFNFSNEIAAGMVLIGCSPSGLASNVMVYLAKANLALSVTLTAISTLLAPFITPLLMLLFTEAFIPIDVFQMMIGIIKMSMLPILLGLLFNTLFHGKVLWLDAVLPKVSMGAIAIIIVIIIAQGSKYLLDIGLLLILAAIIHNISGYILGYYGCRLFKLKKSDCRTIALEVGMQNGGLASGIALELGKLSTVGLAAAIFGPWMNISGSALASWWSLKPASQKS